jgi:hypothetical protein
VISFITNSGLCGAVTNATGYTVNSSEQDTLSENQILYNGRLWRNIYYKIREDQFLFSREFLPGSISVSGKTFKNLKLRYDIYNDQVMIPTDHGSILQLNKEMVDSFNIIFANTTYRFIRLNSDSVKGFSGYVNKLYQGKTALYVKYKKEIELLAVEKKYDMFYQSHRIFIVKDGIVYPVTGKIDLLNTMKEDKAQIKSYLKKNRLQISKKRPESFIPVLRYFDSISH